MKELLRNIQNNEPLGPSLLSFIRRYPWTVAFLILFIAMCVGFWRVDQLADDQNSDRAVRRAENLKRDQDFCRAIPNSVVAGAQALVNIVIADNRKDGASKAELEKIREQGVRYVGEARRLALEQLPECPKILVTRPQDLDP